MSNIASAILQINCITDDDNTRSMMQDKNDNDSDDNDGDDDLRR